MQVMIRLGVILAIIMWPAYGQAQVQQAKGKASVTYEGTATATPEVKAKALRDARVKAIEFHYAEAGEAEAATFDGIRDKIVLNLDRFILDSTTLNEEDRPDVRQYTVVVRVTLNVANLRNAVKSASTVTSTAPSDKSALTFLFVSRQTASVKVYDARVYQRTDRNMTDDQTTSAKQKGSEGEVIGKARMSTDGSSSSRSARGESSSVSTESGGSTVLKANESTWRLVPSSNLNQVFTRIFTTAGFRVAEAAYVEPLSGGKLSVAAVEEDYKSGNDLKSITLQNIAGGLRNAGVPYLAFGTLDVGVLDKDPASGLWRVAVTVNAKILNVASAIPENVAAVGPVQYSGVGPSEDEARTNALKLAADSAARELVSQVTNAKLR